MKFKKVIFCFFVLASSICAHADELDNLNDEQLLREKNLLLQSMELNSTPTIRSVSTTCLASPFPGTPKTPNYSLTDKRYDGTLTLKFWREPCKDNTGSALLVRAIPTQGNPFFCSASLKIIQNAVQLNDIKLQSTPDSSSWCDDLFVASTMIVNQYESGEVQFNPAKTLTVIYENIKLEVPVGGIPIPSISGSAEGYKSYSNTCKNTRTGAVKSFPSSTGTEWNCNGLIIKSGDTVQTIIKGIAK